MKISKVRKCICCDKKKKIKYNVLSYNKTKYFLCIYCKSLCQENICTLNFETDYSKFIIDPDGKKRFLKNEKKNKIKNWYGDTLNFVNSRRENIKLLDFGSGLGFFLSGIKNKKIEKYAFEISKSAKYYLKKNKNVRIINSIKTLSEKKQFFDIVVLYHVIEHLPKPQKILNILNSVLKKNGILIIGTPNIGSMVYKIFKSNYRLLGPGHVCLFNENSLEYLLKKCRFKVFKKEFPFFKTDYFKIRNFIKLFLPWKLSPPWYKSIMTFYAQKKN